jgi:hypothetical protein
LNSNGLADIEWELKLHVGVMFEALIQIEMIHETIYPVVEVVISRELIILTLDITAKVFSGAFKVLHFLVIFIG